MQGPNGRRTDDAVTVEQYDWAVTEPSTAIVETVAGVTGTAVEALPSLYDAVDPDALDALFVDGADTDTPVEVVFTYADHEIVVGADGTLQVLRPS